MLIVFPPFVLYGLAGISVVMLVGASLVYVIKGMLQNIPGWAEKEYTASQKIWLYVFTVLMFLGLGFLVFAFLTTGTNAVTAAAAGSLMLLICVLYLAVMGSPVEIISATPSAGCVGQVMLIPGMIISFAVALVCGWIFALVAVFRGESMKLTVIGLLVLALLAGAILGGAVKLAQIADSENAKPTPGKTLECPPVDTLLDQYLQAKLEDMRNQFRFADLDMVINTQTLEEVEPRYRQEDVGKLKVYLTYSFRIPSFTDDLQARAAARSLAWEDIVLGEKIVKYLDFQDFQVENYTVETVIYCHGILTENGERLSFDITGNGRQSSGTIGRAYNILPDGSYDYDWLFYSNLSNGKSYYSKQEYQNSAK